MMISGAMNGAIFLAYVEQCLASIVKPGDIVIMDKFATHRIAGVRETIEAVGATLHYLAPYSPDLNRSRNLTACSKRSCANAPNAANGRCAEELVNSSDTCPPKPVQISSLTQDTLQRERNPL